MTKNIARLAALAALMLPAACVVEESDTDETDELESVDDDTAIDTEAYVKPIKTLDCNYYFTNELCLSGSGNYWYLDNNSDYGCGDRICVPAVTK
jgi:hypothetical protein